MRIQVATRTVGKRPRKCRACKFYMVFHTVRREEAYESQLDCDEECEGLVAAQATTVVDVEYTRRGNIDRAGSIDWDEYEREILDSTREVAILCGDCAQEAPEHAWEHGSEPDVNVSVDRCSVVCAACCRPAEFMWRGDRVQVVGCGVNE